MSTTTTNVTHIHTQQTQSHVATDLSNCFLLCLKPNLATARGYALVLSIAQHRWLQYNTYTYTYGKHVHTLKHSHTHSQLKQTHTDTNKHNSICHTSQTHKNTQTSNLTVRLAHPHTRTHTINSTLETLANLKTHQHTHLLQTLVTDIIHTVYSNNTLIIQASTTHAHTHIHSHKHTLHT